MISRTRNSYKSFLDKLIEEHTGDLDEWINPATTTQGIEPFIEIIGAGQRWVINSDTSYRALMEWRTRNYELSSELNNSINRLHLYKR